MGSGLWEESGCGGERVRSGSLDYFLEVVGVRRNRAGKTLLIDEYLGNLWLTSGARGRYGGQLSDIISATKYKKTDTSEVLDGSYPK